MKNGHAYRTGIPEHEAHGPTSVEALAVANRGDWRGGSEGKMSRALVFTLNGAKFFMVDDLRPSRVDEIYRHWQQFFPEDEPAIVNVEISERKVQKCDSSS